ncbi:MAG: M43 family zinc metalloprotease [Saprospiraceae bacterium]
MRNSIFTLSGLLIALVGNLNAQSYQFQQESLPCLNKKFTVVAHIFKDSLGNFGATEADIRQAVAGINPFFEPICASFEVCEFRYHENWQHDILEDPDTEIPQIKTKYHADFRINIYFVTTFTSTINACGLASGSIGDPTNSGIIIRKDCINVGTIAHEMGHFFGLAHTFEGNGTELVDGSNCDTAGDGICDTPADPYVPGDPKEDYVNSDCIFISPKTDANGEYYNPDLGNIMSYYDCGSCGFTWGQLNKMANTYLNAGVKFW